MSRPLSRRSLYRRSIIEVAWRAVAGCLLAIVAGPTPAVAFQDVPAAAFQDTPRETLKAGGLTEPVEILKDRWGISHIYAKNQHDLFFAQGYNVARDRLFQLEMWRRKATGTVAEILGNRGRAVLGDTGVRRLKLRADMRDEMNHYHPDGEEIITAFVEGINAYIDSTRENPDLLPLEFRLLGLEPQHWTPEVVVSRHNGLYRNVTSEVGMARRVLAMGADAVVQSMDLHPGTPELAIPEGVDYSLIPNQVFDLYRAARSRIRFRREDIVLEEYRSADEPETAAMPDER